MNITILVDGAPVATLDATNVWRDLLVYSADRWEAEAPSPLAAALEVILHELPL